MKKIGKHIFPIFFVLLVASTDVKAQKNTAGAGLHEIGLGLGGLNYTGDLSPKYYFSNYRPGGILYYRFNISPVVSLRASVIAGSLGANESKYKDPIPASRGLKFSGFLTELGASVEYNFLNFRPKKEVYRFSPYFTAGFCFFNTKNSGGQLGVPIGVGLKYRLSRRLNLNFEAVARKTFTDNLDGEQQFLKYNNPNPNKQTFNTKNKDWYYYTGISISWAMFSVVCPDPFLR